jgi:FlaA1/EpsC-like NDP-sugar epimerase
MIRRHLLWLCSIGAAAFSLLASFLLRFDYSIPASEISHLERGLAIFMSMKLLVFCSWGRRRSLWNMVGVPDLLYVAMQCAIASIIATVSTIVIVGPAFPRSVYVIDAIIFFIVMESVLFSRRIYQDVTSRVPRTGRQKTILIYGAGAAGMTLLRELRSNRQLGYSVVGFLDDDPGKRKATIGGVPVIAEGRDAARIVLRNSRRNSPIEEIVIAMPSISGSEMRTVVANCRATGVPFKIVPGFGELLQNRILTNQIREVSVNDLLGRDPVHVSEEAIGQHISGRSVMVTGGCGSIGSELCRQLARFNPSRLVVFDQAESEMFTLALELRGQFPSLKLVTEIGDIVRYQRVSDAMARNSVQAVFHAAAYKHVPLMEAHIIEAAENNVIGTWNVVRAAHENEVENFLMISSDKAVNPSSIMGVTKRIGELIVSAMPIAGGPLHGSFVSVRFGNVLASNGSVVTVFKRQIAAGGPVTVTHPDMRRYFMSIPEAVQLVLQASSMGQGGEIFVLDMGEPIRIMDLASNMIQLAGLTPGEDIKIENTGLRPGEKLYEELSMDAEDMVPTYHQKIRIFRSSAPAQHAIGPWLKELQILINDGDADDIKAHLLELVPEYIGPRETRVGVKAERRARRAHA